MAESSPLLIEPLASCHNRAAFSCGVKALDDYLRQQATQNIRRNVAVTFVLVESDKTDTKPKTKPAAVPVSKPAIKQPILGFYTLSATSVKLNDLPEATAKKLPKYPLVPAILLGRLAVDQGQCGKRYGELLLMDALKRCADTKDIGWAAVIVDAKDDSSAAFYERYQFIRFSPESLCLFLPRDTILSLFHEQP
jgi:hypothetical protein